MFAKKFRFVFNQQWLHKIENQKLKWERLQLYKKIRAIISYPVIQTFKYTFPDQKKMNLKKIMQQVILTLLLYLKDQFSLILLFLAFLHGEFTFQHYYLDLNFLNFQYYNSILKDTTELNKTYLRFSLIAM
ncbi:unnamed protein product [Paramecium sonneborni]|uniref:Transmembrane protein n=1 Tax=Paramecium sonneborni TaxID=65129 RepID=A0A8S1NKL5_9CILI|nr:unnamed protein product [Paramecium sonneborni]